MAKMAGTVSRKGRILFTDGTSGQIIDEHEQPMGVDYFGGVYVFKRDEDGKYFVVDFGPDMVEETKLPPWANN